MARALRTASLWFNSWMLGWATGRLHRNLASLSMSPLSSRVSQTVATWLTEKDKVGRARYGQGTSGPFAFGGVVPAADIFPKRWSSRDTPILAQFVFLEVLPGLVAVQEARGSDLCLLLDLLMIRRSHARYARSLQADVMVTGRLSTSLSTPPEF